MTLEEENVALKERVAVLEGELGLVRDVEKAAAIKRRLGLSPQQAHVMVSLAAVYPRAVQRWALEETLPAMWRTGEDGNFINVHISRIRNKLGRDTVITHQRSYALSPAGYARFQAAVIVEQVGRAA